jgi:uncharacterized DUF497 family protein
MTATFDPKKDAENLTKHGVSLSEGDGVLSDPLAVTIEDESAEGEQRFVTLGANTFGKLMVVVWTPRDEDVRIISVRKPTPRERRKEGIMKKEYNFSKGKRGAVIPQVGKTRITIYLDDGVLERFKAQSQKTGKGYQTLINDALNSYLGLTAKPVTEEMVRKIVREELANRN